MEKMTDLQDLLKHEIKDLYSAEEQIIQAMPRMIEKVSNPQLRQALEMHLRVTEGQLKRLQQVQQLMEQENGQSEDGQAGNGLFSRLMRRRTQGAETGSGGEKCLGMEGLLKEGEKVMAEEMEPSVLDAAIIACAQKIEHYEICGYGTARAYARELDMGEVAELLEETLDEEYEADDRLTDLAVSRLNEEAEKGGSSRGRRSSASSSTGRSGSRSTASKSTSRSRSGTAVAASSSRGGSSSGRGSSGSGGSKASSTRSSSTSGRSAGRTKTAAKASSSRGGSAAPAGRASASRSTSKSSGRSTSNSSNTRSAAGSRSSKAPSKAAAAKGGRNSSGGGRTASKSSGRGSSSGRSTGRR